MWRNPEAWRVMVATLLGVAKLWQDNDCLGVGFSQQSTTVNLCNYLTACWPAPAALHTNSRIFTGTPWLRNSDDSVPDAGNLWPSGPVEYGEDGRLWWYPGRKGRTQEKSDKERVVFFQLQIQSQFLDKSCWCWSHSVCKQLAFTLIADCMKYVIFHSFSLKGRWPISCTENMIIKLNTSNREWGGELRYIKWRDSSFLFGEQWIRGENRWTNGGLHSQREVLSDAASVPHPVLVGCQAVPLLSHSPRVSNNAEECDWLCEKLRL